MNCKNCQTELLPEDKYCNECGAIVVNERITLKSLVSGLLVSLGWDNQFFHTFRDLVLRPQTVFEKYLNGTRKRYTNPFTFFALGAALSVLVLGFYSDELIGISTSASLKPTETLLDNYHKDGIDGNESHTSTELLAQNQNMNEKLFNFLFSYYYYLSFLLLPFYTFIAFLIYGKPDNYGEHLVINAYIQGLIFFFGIILFFITLLLHTEVYTSGSLIVTVIYYLYAYKKYRRHSFGKTMVILLKFLGMMLAFMILLAIIGFIIGLTAAK